ncbi:unnamed protein product [Eruca vesicaria subsp. sativa]|uniref:Uncharacterized protein n=1 Tax=Eruca vesicaria subsp. sativa TaxID=29727 RepID=A0ABC8JZ46_ERUVS|nr:unnamed protein product [Eruca vesicaria subsp. sativa]
MKITQRRLLFLREIRSLDFLGCRLAVSSSTRHKAESIQDVERERAPSRHFSDDDVTSSVNQQRLLTSSAAARLLRLSVSTDAEGDNKSNGSDHAKLFNTPASSPLRRSLSSSCDDVRASLSVKGQQADAHCMKLLHNRYLQWRFANASAQVKTQAQKAQAEIPYLEQWITLLEEEYLTSVSETSETLLNASLWLPFDADIKVEYKELAETLDVASKFMEGIVQNIGNFVPKTQEMETLMSELAKVSSSEKASVEDSGVALLNTHSSHIEECYLRSQLIQHHHQKCELQGSKHFV